MMIEKLTDRESVILYNARIAYMQNQDYAAYWNEIHNLYSDWKCTTMEFMNIKAAYSEGREVILYGCGFDGYWTKNTLEIFGIKASFYSDGNSKKWGTFVNGLLVIAPEEMKREHDNALIVITTGDYKEKVLDELLKMNIVREHIVVPKYGKIVAKRGNQYFDIWDPIGEEYFIDAGAYDGQTTIDFRTWAGESYKGSYIFEPFLSSKEYIDKKTKNIDNVNVYYNAVWDKNERLNFGGNDRSATIDGDKEIVQGVTIDEIIGDRPVTFIKMDIEGSEINALLGAKKTIQKNTPKLAICIYHKLDDVITIPNLIEELNPNYKFAIRHYTSCMWETVLYAWVED